MVAVTILHGRADKLGSVGAGEGVQTQAGRRPAVADRHPQETVAVGTASGSVDGPAGRLKAPDAPMARGTGCRWRSAAGTARPSLDARLRWHAWGRPRSPPRCPWPRKRRERDRVTGWSRHAGAGWRRAAWRAWAPRRSSSLSHRCARTDPGRPRDRCPRAAATSRTSGESDTRVFDPGVSCARTASMSVRCTQRGFGCGGGNRARSMRPIKFGGSRRSASTGPCCRTGNMVRVSRASRATLL